MVELLNVVDLFHTVGDTSFTFFCIPEGVLYRKQCTTEENLKIKQP